MKKYVVEFEICNDLDILYNVSEIKFLGDRGYHLLEGLEGFLSEDLIAKKFVEFANLPKNKDAKKELYRCYIEELLEDGYIYNKLEISMQLLIDVYGLDTIIDEFLTDELEAKFINFLGLQSGVVGYSGWSYYIAKEYIPRDYICSLWEGYNFYDITILDFESGEAVDTLGGVYLTNDVEIKAALSDNLGVDLKNDDVHILENDESEYILEDFKRVQEVYTFTRFKEVE